MKKVLIITYYWPPSGGGGVQRWLKFVKYLRDFGWEPVIYTHENGEVPVIDESLNEEVPYGLTVLKKKIWEPYQFYKWLTGQKSSEKVQTGFLSEGKKPGLGQKIATWIRGNFFIPDARCFWIKPSIKYLNQQISEIQPDLIVTTGPPHSMHLIGEGLRDKWPDIPWIADFRDPWTNIDFYPRLMLTRWADQKHRRLEKKVLRKADQVITVSPNWAKDFEELGAKNVQVITNGYDSTDFPEAPPQPDQEFTLTHAGYLNQDRNPENLWKALSELIEENQELKKALKVRFIGKTDYAVWELLSNEGLAPYAEKIDYVPHTEAIRICQQSQMLLLLLSDTPEAMGRIPGKLFEYMATHRPVLAIGPEDGDSAKIIHQTHCGQAINFTDKASLKNHVRKSFEAYKNGALKIDPKDIEAYERRNLTRSLTEVFGRVMGGG